MLMFALLLLHVEVEITAQSTATIEGVVIDQNRAVVSGVEIKAISRAIAVEWTAVTDHVGRYQLSALPVGDYRVEVTARGFQQQVIDSVQVNVPSRLKQDFQQLAGQPSEHVTVDSTNGVMERTSTSGGLVPC